MDVVRVRAEDRAQVATVIGGIEYRQNKGYFHMPEQHAKVHREIGNLPAPSAALPVGRSSGFRCVTCGFGSFFMTCSRCNGHCERE